MLGWIVAGALGLLPFLLGLAWFNWVRFGGWTETGYAAAHLSFIGGVQLFETPFWAGLGGMLISPGKGVFVYNPILLLALVGWPGLYRLSRGMALIAATVFAVVVLAHSKYTFWAGDFTWGSRYLASTMGFCVLGLAPLIDRKRWRAALWGVAALSGAIQVASTVFSYGLEFAQDRRHGSIPDEYVWRLPESHLVMRFRNMALYALGRPIYDSIPPAVIRPAFHQVPTSPDVVRLNHVVHYFPFKAYLFTSNVRVFRLLLGVWLLDLLAVIAVAVWWRAFVHRSHVHVSHEAP
ncbi:MAG: hypothetical protein HZB38_00830 [Planctomycetes bacterium]|nr:hypothetical protein [Planctomycetota bacterium]